MIYLACIFVSVFFAFCADRTRPRTKLSFFGRKLFQLLAFLPPFLISGLRAATVGSDTNGTYRSIFEATAAGHGSGIRDTGYLLINQLSLLFSDNFQLVLVVTSALCCGLAYYHIFSKSKHPAVSTLLFFITNIFFISMNMVRQTIATMIFMFAIPALRDRKPVRYFLICLAAASVHTSAIIYVLLYFVAGRKIDIKRSLAVVILLLILKAPLAALIRMVVFKIPFLMVHFGWYFGSGYDEGAVSLVSLLISIAVLLFIFICRFDAKKDDFYLNFATWSAVIACVMLAISDLVPLMQRTSYLFSFMNFILLPNVIDNVRDRRFRNFFMFSIILGYSAYTLTQVFVMGYNEVYPYVLGV